MRAAIMSAVSVSTICGFLNRTIVDQVENNIFLFFIFGIENGRKRIKQNK